MTIPITVLAFDDDALIFNRTLGDRYSLAPDCGIGAPLERVAAGTVTSDAGLFWFGTKLSPDGLATLRHWSRRDRVANRLRLNEGEYFGLRLAAWRDIEGTRYEPDFAYDFIDRVGRLATYKIEAAAGVGDLREVTRLRRARTAILNRMLAKLAEDLALERGLNAMIQRNRDFYHALGSYAARCRARRPFRICGTRN